MDECRNPVRITEKKALTCIEISEALWKTKGLGEDRCRPLLEPLLRENPRVSMDEDGRWQGVEAFFQNPLLPKVTFAVVDIETTGGRPPQHRITELAAVKVRGGEVVGERSALVNPGRSIPRSVVRLTGITDQMVSGQPPLTDQLPRFLDFIEGCVFVAHCASFDYNFIEYFAREFLGRRFDPPALCTFKLAQRLLPGAGRYNLGDVSALLNLRENGRHRAGGDARTTAQLLGRFLGMLQLLGLESLEEVLAYQEMPKKEKPPLAEGMAIDPAELNSLPEGRGIFRFFDEKGEAVYAGRAVDIQRAVVDLFHPKNRAAERFSKKLRTVKRVEAIRFESELGMSLLSGREMREAKFSNGVPPGGNFSYLKIDLIHKFPSVLPVLGFSADGGAHYGPLRKQAQLQALLQVIHAAFPLRGADLPEKKGAFQGKSPAGGATLRPSSYRLPSLSPRQYRDIVERLQSMLEGGGDRASGKGVEALLERSWGGGGPSPAELKKSLTHLRHLIRSYALSGPPVERRNLFIVEPGETMGERVCYIVRNGILVEEIRFKRDLPPADALRGGLHRAFFEANREFPTPSREALEEAGVIAGWMRRELMEGFMVEISPEADEEEVFQSFLEALADPSAAGTTISL